MAKFAKKIKEEPVAALRFIKNLHFRRQTMGELRLDEKENDNFDDRAAQNYRQSGPG
jgi:hypothetical protein